jgi:hypothetical protein
VKIKKSTLIETVKRVLREEDFDASKFPFPKPDSQGAYAKHVAQAGKPDKDGGDPADDVVSFKDRSDLKASELSPSQKEIKLGQALGMAVSMIGKLPGPFKTGPGGDLGAVISKDGYIMDGHHRWAASIFAAGNEIELGGKVIDMGGEDLVQVLALMGDALHPGERKKPSPHNIMNATADDVNNFVNKFVTDGIGEFVDAETAKRVLEDAFGSVEDAKTHFIAQLPHIKKEPPEWAESRDKMPVLEPDAGEPKKVGDAMAAGDVDVYYPYADAPANRKDKKGIKEMKFNKKRIETMVRESLKKKMRSLNEEEPMTPPVTRGEGKEDTAGEPSTIGRKASKSGISTLKTHLEKLKAHGSYEMLKKEASKGAEQKLQLLDMFMGDMLGVSDEVLKPIAQQIINAFRKGAK